MIGALIYLQAQSIKNRLRVRLRRLKKPKYLTGAVVGAAYFYFFFFCGATDVGVLATAPTGSGTVFVSRVCKIVSRLLTVQ